MSIMPAGWQNDVWSNIQARRRSAIESMYPTMGSDVQGGLQSLVTNYNTAYDQAKAKNQALYSKMLGVVDTTTGQRAADIRSDYGQQSSNTMQQLARTGMSNTTIAPTMQMGIEREKQSSLNRLSDELMGTRLNVMGNYGWEQTPDRSSLQSTLAGATSMYGSKGIGSLLTALGGIKY